MAFRRTVRFNSGVARGARRQVDWAIAFTNTTFTSLAAATTVNLGGGLALSAISNEPFTIIRMRGVLGISQSQVAADQEQCGAIGVVPVQLRAAVAGVGSMPRPGTDPLADYMLYQQFTQKSEFISGTGVETKSAELYTLDSKAMRRIDQPGEMSLAVLVENLSATAILHSLQMRVLVKFS